MKNILITGACGGMGKATCEILRQKGYNVFCLDYVDSDAENFYKVDVTNSQSILDAFNAISTKVEYLDAIIHFAGIYKLDSLVEMQESEFLRIFDVNVFGIYRVNKIFMPLLKEKSRIIITSSELAPLEPLPFTGIYGITKTTIEKYAYSLRMELQLLGIDVVVIRPGAVDTGLLTDSTNALEKFTDNTKLYQYNAQKFKDIVESVESKKISTQKLAKLVLKSVEVKKPKYVYNINRNILLKLLNILPKKMQTKVIKKILKS